MHQNIAIRSLAIIGLACFGLIGCERFGQAGIQARAEREGAGATQPASASAPSVSSQRDATAEQWTQAIGRIFDKVNVKRLRDKKNPAYIEDGGTTDENGVTAFFACFDKAPPKCELPASGKRDGFRKIQFFTDPALAWSDTGAKYAGSTGKPSVGAYVSLQDCNLPKVVLLPTFRASNWIFVEQFGVMVDGAIVIERKFDSSQIDRENSHNAVSESMHVVLTDREVDGLRKVVKAQQVLIRLTGQKGYVGIDQEGTKEFVQGIARSLRMHDALMQAANRVGLVKDTACPA